MPIIAFPLLVLLPWNRLYPAIAARTVGGAANVVCRPDLARNTLMGGTLFLAFYALFIVLLLVAAPGYIQQVWNLPKLSGLLLGGIPLEELAFGFTFGLYWAGLYEHFTWKRGIADAAGRARPERIAWKGAWLAFAVQVPAFRDEA